MFTGIVQEIGTIRDRIPVGEAVRFVLDAPRLAPGLAVGDSVACDGVCLTVERLEPSADGAGFSVCAVSETLAKTTLSLWGIGGQVNLEPALTATASLGGHFVLGHVDGVCEVTDVEYQGDGGREMTVSLPPEFLPYCVYKGSITIAGVSLTIAAVEDDRVRVALIPHTLAATTLGLAAPRSRLNFETDVLAKHIEKQLALRASAGMTHAPSPRKDRMPIPEARS